jgi:hypothetical protein
MMVLEVWGCLGLEASLLLMGRGLLVFSSRLTTDELERETTVGAARCVYCYCMVLACVWLWHFWAAFFGASGSWREGYARYTRYPIPEIPEIPKQISSLFLSRSMPGYLLVKVVEKVNTGRLVGKVLGRVLALRDA